MNIFSLSFGKDSMATLILAAEQGIPIDRVMYCDIRFNDEISGEHPIMAEWIPTAEKRLKELFGVTVDHAYSGVGFEDVFFTKKQNGKHIGDMYGFPYMVGAWCNDRLKLRAIRSYIRSLNATDIVEFLGIAADEPQRWKRKTDEMETGSKRYRSLLVEQNLTEQDAMNLCRKYDLLSPMYEVDGIYRGGCWFCPKQCLADLHSLWRQYPELWDKLVAMEPYSFNTFKPRGVTLKSLAERFENGYVPKRKVRSNVVQLNMFGQI